MKKSKITFIIIVFIIGLCSFFSYHGAILSDGSNATTRTCNQIVDALEASDSNAIKQLFSNYVRSNAIDLDEGIAYIMQLYQGTHETIRCAPPGSSGTIKIPEWTETLTTRCDIVTDQGKYVLYIVYRDFDLEHPSKIGLYAIELFLSDSIETHSTHIFENNFPHIGIYHPKWDTTCNRGYYIKNP